MNTHRKALNSALWEGVNRRQVVDRSQVTTELLLSDHSLAGLRKGRARPIRIIEVAVEALPSSNGDSAETPAAEVKELTEAERGQEEKRLRELALNRLRAEAVVRAGEHRAEILTAGVVIAGIGTALLEMVQQGTNQGFTSTIRRYNQEHNVLGPAEQPELGALESLVKSLPPAADVGQINPIEQIAA